MLDIGDPSVSLSNASDNTSGIALHNVLSSIHEEAREAMLHDTTLSVFTHEADRLRFEDCINVNLGMLDEYYDTHEIDQDVVPNDDSQQNTPPRPMLLYSCKNCNKIFKTLAFTRAHVLTHTDLRPYQCFKCTYTTNTKGEQASISQLVGRGTRGGKYKYFLCIFCSLNPSTMGKNY